MLKKTAVRVALSAIWVLLVLAAVVLLAVRPVPASAEGEYPVYQEVELEAVICDPLDYASPAPYKPHADAYLPGQTGYLDLTTSVRIDTFRAFNTTLKAAWVTVASPTQLRAAGYAAFPSEKTIDATKLARREKAVLALNGDFIVYLKTGYSVRNGKVLSKRYNEKAAHDFDALCIDDEGTFTIIRNMDAASIDAYNATHTIIHAFTFGPGLVVDGCRITEFGSRFQPTHRTQRMGIGQMPDGSYLVVCCEGPDDAGSTGLTLYEFAEVFDRLGAYNAYNLDGGSSSWLVLDYKRINGPYASNHREIADIIYFVTATPGGDE